MAKLILTDKEKADGSYLDWDDSALANAVRKMALKFEDEVGSESLSQAAIASYLVNQNIKSNAETIELTLKGIRQGDKNLGDYKITIQQLNT